MIYLSYVLYAAVALVGIGLAAIATQRNLIAIVLAVELILMGSTVALVGFISYSSGSAFGILALLSIWAVAIIEIIALIAFYVYMKSKGYSMDVSLLSKLKW